MSARQPTPDRERQSEHERRTGPTPFRSRTPLLLAISAAAVLLHLLQNILLPFVIAAVIAYVCAPLVDWLMARARLPRWSAALCLFAMLVGAGTLLGFLGLPPLLRLATSVVADLHGTVADITRVIFGASSVQLLGSTLDAQRVADLAVGTLHHEITAAQLLSLIGWGAAGVFGFMLVLVLIGYFLLDAPGIASGLLWLVPPPGRAQAEHIWRRLDRMLRRYFLGVFGVVAYTTAAAYLGLGVLLGLHHAFVLAVLTGLLEPLPVVGPLVSAVIAGLAAVQQATSSRDIWAYVGYATALRLSIDQLVGPVVLGSAARLRPFVVMFCLLAGGALFGIVGVILAVPLALVVKVTLSVLYRETR